MPGWAWPGSLWRIAFLSLAGFAGATVAQPAAPEFWQQEAALRIHDPSTIVREGDRFWTFSTGMGLKSFWSTNLLEWQSGPRVLPQMPPWVKQVVADQRGDYWAPDVIRVNDRWLLYYSVSRFGKNTSAIALVTTPTLTPTAGKVEWHDAGIVIQSERTNDFNTIDPAAFADRDGRLWLAFGSYWSGIKLVELDPQTGHRRAPNAPLGALAAKAQIEAPFLYRHADRYYLFVNWGQCCQGTNSTYEIRVGRSDQVTGPYRDREDKDLRTGGGTLVLGSEGAFIGPGHASIVTVAGQEWFSFHYYDARNRGRPTLGLRKLTWDKEGWPEVASDAGP
jgi:arabinan endo-1,5-alpha-L-arabinosidase